jgi:phosphatidate cytidylyltransferase
VITRIVTGAVLAIVAVVVIVYGGLVYFGVMLALALIGLNEYFQLTKRYRPLPLAGFVAIAAMMYMAWFHTPLGVLGAIALGALLIALSGLLIGAKQGVSVRMAVTLLGMLYLGLGFAHLLLLRDLEAGRDIVLTIIFGTWAGDTMAYFIGRFFGSHLMVPTLSPKKTWEGFAGGVIGTILLVVLIGLYTALTPLQSLALGAVIAVVGPAGDLFESLIKRDVQIKDSGRGLPGHGGVLDRFDALLWTSVASYYLLTVVFPY